MWLEQARRSDADRLRTLSGQSASGPYEHTRRQIIDRPQSFWDYWEKQTATSGLTEIFNFINVSDRAESGPQSIWRTWKDTFSQEPALEELHLPARIKLMLPYSNVRVDRVIPTYAALPETGNKRLIFEKVSAKGSAGTGVSDIASETNPSERTVQKFSRNFLRWVFDKDPEQSQMGVL